MAPTEDQTSDNMKPTSLTQQSWDLLYVRAENLSSKFDFLKPAIMPRPARCVPALTPDACDSHPDTQKPATGMVTRQ